MNKNAPVLFGLLALTAGCAQESPPAADTATNEPFAIEEATIAGMHAAIRAGRTTCVGVVEAYIERAKAYNGVCTALVTADGADIAPALGYTRAGKPLEFPTQTVAASTVFPELDELQRAAARVRPHGTDGFGPFRRGADRHARRHPRRGPGQRARDVEHPRRALRHVQRRVRRASVDGPAAGGRAGGVRGVPQAARRARARRRARRAVRRRIPTSPHCRCIASSPP